MAFNIECFLADEFENFSPVCNTLFAQHSEKSNLRHIENQTSYSTLPAFIFVHNSRGRYGEATIKNELALYVMLDSY